VMSNHFSLLVKSGYARGLSCTSSVRAKLTIDCWWSLVIALQYYVQIEDSHLDSYKKNSLNKHVLIQTDVSIAVKIQTCCCCFGGS
jgi:hypothetical protein